MSVAGVVGIVQIGLFKPSKSSDTVLSQNFGCVRIKPLKHVVRRERLKVNSILLLMPFLMFHINASACPCLAIEADGKDRANLIFTGTVISVEDIGSMHQSTTFQIDSSEKGPSSGEVQVVSDNRRDTGCSAQFTNGNTYTVYTYESEYLDINTFEKIKVPNYTNACSRKSP